MLLFYIVRSQSRGKYTRIITYYNIIKLPRVISLLLLYYFFCLKRVYNNQIIIINERASFIVWKLRTSGCRSCNGGIQSPKTAVEFRWCIRDVYPLCTEAFMMYPPPNIHDIWTLTRLGSELPLPNIGHWNTEPLQGMWVEP